MTSAGELRERVIFERRSAADDGYGNTVSGNWAAGFSGSVAAGIKPLRGGETIQASRLAGKQPVLITVRRSSNTLLVTTDWRARDTRSGVIYNIRSIVDPDGRKQWLDMECESGVAV